MPSISLEYPLRIPICPGITEIVYMIRKCKKENGEDINLRLLASQATWETIWGRPYHPSNQKQASIDSYACVVDDDMEFGYILLDWNLEGAFGLTASTLSEETLKK